MSVRVCLAVLISALATAVPEAWAGTVESGASESAGSFLLDSVALVVIFACLLATFKIYFAIRGGKVGRGWLWFLLGFSVLSITQLILFGQQLGVVSRWGSGMWIDALRLVSSALLLVGITRFRRLLA